MRRRLLGAMIVLGALANGVSAQDLTHDPAQDEGPDELRARVVSVLEKADPLAEGSTSSLLAPDDATSVAVAKIAGDDTTPEIARDRAQRLGLALNRVHRVSEALHVESRAVVWWLALDELDRELPRGPRESLLTLAIPDEERRDEALTQLAAGRDVAERFCREWNEFERNAAETKRYAALRAELKGAGKAAIPYLATLLAVPPQAAFPVLDDARGITARQQVRALWALQILDARSCTPYALFHVRGPSFTQSSAARSVLRHLSGIEYPPGSDEAAQLAFIDERWRKGWTVSWERDHLVRHTLRWARIAITSGDQEREHAAGYAPLQLSTLVGDLEFDPEAAVATRTEQLLAIERHAILRCPACIR